MSVSKTSDRPPFGRLKQTSSTFLPSSPRSTRPRSPPRWLLPSSECSLASSAKSRQTFAEARSRFRRLSTASLALPLVQLASLPCHVWGHRRPRCFFSMWKMCTSSSLLPSLGTFARGSCSFRTSSSSSDGGSSSSSSSPQSVMKGVRSLRKALISCASGVGHSPLPTSAIPQVASRRLAISMPSTTLPKTTLFPSSGAQAFNVM
mmetsp:Transcript_57959/g.164682  ORF Transcript_57959/g.164682 Transcript_57959/m.164682 type:complete len:205 (+) Transcript_57959:116-730(+)